ncbi:chlorohydrolase family protein [Streptomyces indicus]|uniref:Cytosine/adenosine deaminase n=1 Tax=Streptomyces indicus TaxID=417292 RepID=A0A1G8TBX8_9ACTN|nr:chlorohydrolase family protein [Streptomyces indicus]SDJ39076.1 Cytosine/adenosine deaminase [Streptomyces indicus]
MHTRWRAAHVLAYQNGHHALLREGEVVWQNDTIVHVGRGWEGPVDRDVDLGDRLVLPGLIDLDALTDIDHLILDSWASAETGPGLQWSRAYAARSRDVFTRAQRKVVREYALVQLALHGITTYMPIASEVHSSWAETFEEFADMAETSRRIGLRGYLGPSYRSAVNIVDEDGRRDLYFDEERGRAGLRDAERFLDHSEALADPLVQAALLPCRVETMTPELLRATAELARRRGVPVRLHCLQGTVERELVHRLHDCTPLELIERSGLFDTHLLIPHGIVIDRHPSVSGEDTGDLDTLVRAGVSVIHCPQTSLRYGDVLHSFGDYRAAGLNLCLGTDSFPPDLIRGMDLGVHLAKVVDGRADAAPAEAYVEAATLGGARALGRDDLGRIAPGARADLVAFRLDDIRDGVLDDPVRTLLLNGTARNATHSVVDGRPVLVDGTLPGVDIEALRAEAQALFATMRAAYGERDHKGRSADELFPPSFPAFDEAR